MATTPLPCLQEHVCASNISPTLTSIPLCMCCVTCQNPVTRAEIEDLCRAGDEAQLNALLGSRMTFGTAGKSFEAVTASSVVSPCKERFVPRRLCKEYYSSYWVCMWCAIGYKSVLIYSLIHSSPNGMVNVWEKLSVWGG